MSHNSLPFARGEVWSDGLVTLTDTIAESLAGRTYECNDTVHGTGEPVTLRIVRNDSGAALTSSYRPLRWATGELDIGRGVAGFANAQGQRCIPMDDAYTAGTSIADMDLFYAVDEGPCYIYTEATTVNLAAHDPVCADATGYLDGTTATTGDYVIGVIDQASTTTSEAVVVHVHEGLSTVL